VVKFQRNIDPIKLLKIIREVIVSLPSNFNLIFKTKRKLVSYNNSKKIKPLLNKLKLLYKL
jgi:hypothetical protein